MYGDFRFDDVIASPDVTFGLEPQPGGTWSAIRVTYSGDGPRFVPVFEHTPEPGLGYGVLRFRTSFVDPIDGIPVRPENRYTRNKGREYVITEFTQNEDYPTDYRCTQWLPLFARPASIQLGLHFDGPGQVDVESFVIDPYHHPYGLAVAILLSMTLIPIIWIQILPEGNVRGRVVSWIRKRGMEFYVWFTVIGVMGSVGNDELGFLAVFLVALLGLAVVMVASGIRARINWRRARKTEV
jgi:hypothetical protein